MKNILLLSALITAASCNKCATFYYESDTTQHFVPYKTQHKEWTEDHCGDNYKAKKKQKDIYYPYDGAIVTTYEGVACDVHIHLIKYK